MQTHEPREPQELAEQIKDYLRGMKRVRAAHMVRLAEFDEWQRIARAEIERRATSVVEMLDDEMLAAVARGDINLPAAIREVLNEKA